MDDTTISNVKSQMSNVGQTNQQPQPSPAGQSPPQVQPVSPIVKEQEPRSVGQEPVGTEQAGTEEFVKPTEEAPTVPKEVAEVGVEKIPQVPDLTLEDQKAGLTLAKEATPVPTQPSGIVQFPKSEDEAKKLARLHNRVADSVHWWLELIVKHFKRMHDNIAS